MKSTSSQPQTHFTGSIPMNYEEYLGPMFFESYAKDIGELIDPSTVNTALELGCGTGRVTRELSRALLPTSRIIASDISAEMLSVAKQKVVASNVEWHIVSADTLPFENNSIDLVVCYFAYMFLPDKLNAYAEALRVLRKGGMLLMATWDKLEANEASNVFRTAVKRYLGDNLPETYKLPFSMHNSEAIKSTLQQAGFSKVNSNKVAKISSAESAAWAARGLVRGGSLYNELVKQNPAWVEEIVVMVERELAEKYGKAPMRAPMSAIITQAWK